MVERSETSGGIGKPVQRKEDRRLLTGKGYYVADVRLPNAAYAVLVRSPHAHARLRGIDTDAARASPGVIAVLTGKDLIADGLHLMDHKPSLVGPPDVAVTVRPGFKTFVHGQPMLPADKARYVGEPVALVVAESIDQAKDGAELVEVEYQVLPAVAMAKDALDPKAAKVWDEAESNLVVDVDVGDRAAADAAFAKAAHVVRFETWCNRVTGTPMEPRNAVGDYDPTTDLYTLYAGTGSGVARERGDLASVLGVPIENVRALCGDMGGNFGTRNFFFPEYALLPWAAKRIGRPVKWLGDRTESFVSDYQGRDLTVEAELALDQDGKFLAMRGTNISNLGAHTIVFVPLRKGLGQMSGVYDIPAVHFRGCAVVTNTPPTTPYRSAGRPEAVYVLERLVDLAADQCGFDPVALRRRNFIPEKAFPYTNAVGQTYDNGQYEKGMDAALKLADWNGFAGRKAESKKHGKLRGFGIGNYVEIAGGFPRERAEVTVAPEGRVELVLGTMNSGQGHETSFAQLLTEWLGVPFESVDYVAHDTKRVSAGGGSHSGRSMRLASLVIGIASDKIIEKGKKIASYLLEASVADIEFTHGRFGIKGTDRYFNIFDVAKAAATRSDLPDDLKGKLDGIGDQVVTSGAWPSGTHICEVEVDPDTGAVEILHWSGVDDVGLAINPMILHGQTHGAAAQGIGQALLELCHYDRESGQNLSASFMDYAVPRADMMPSFNTALIEVPATSHRYGIRPGGEGGTTPALAAVINAIVDALSELGVRHVEMPATPERVWQAIRAAKAAAK
ncbi:MAG TPA: xanthine dehydrogenase family protein molybdopterin-binding subunit [Stellaceae bacterium]|nr:xanthine dehydrogenase family protein molybdopterin-binding subunit [Stellaceae bacterium]